MNTLPPYPGYDEAQTLAAMLDGTISAAFVDFLGSWCGTLPLGAENTITRRLTAPDISGFCVSTAYAGGSTEYKTPSWGNTCWPTLYGFFSHPVHSILTVAEQTHPTLTPPLKRRSTRKGSPAMFSAPFFPATRNEVAA